MTSGIRILPPMCHHPTPSTSLCRTMRLPPMRHHPLASVCWSVRVRIGSAHTSEFVPSPNWWRIDTLYTQLGVVPSVSMAACHAAHCQLPTALKVALPRYPQARFEGATLQQGMSAADNFLKSGTAFDMSTPPDPTTHYPPPTLPGANLTLPNFSLPVRPPTHPTPPHSYLLGWNANQFTGGHLSHENKTKVMRIAANRMGIDSCE